MVEGAAELTSTKVALPHTNYQHGWMQLFTLSSSATAYRTLSIKIFSQEVMEVMGHVDSSKPLAKTKELVVLVAVRVGILETVVMVENVRTDIGVEMAWVGIHLVLVVEELAVVVAESTQQQEIVQNVREQVVVE